MGKGLANTTAEDAPLAGIEDAATADNNEAAALPLGAGFNRGAVTWIMEPINQFDQPAPSEGKK